MATRSPWRPAVAVRFSARLRLIGASYHRAQDRIDHQAWRVMSERVWRIYTWGAVTATALARAPPAFGAVRAYDFNGDGRQELASPLGSSATIVVRTNRRGLKRPGQVLSLRTFGRGPAVGHGLDGGVASG